jgi:glucosamine 6-phosphate synthetase-like amidotransferase/phosphosugar isomerase protein
MNTVEETLASLIDVYLERTHLPPVQIIHLLMERLRGRFVLMTLFTLEKGELMIIARRDYPLFFGIARRFFSVPLLRY